MSKRTRLLSKLKHVYSHNTKLVLDVSNDDIGLIIEALEIKDEIKKKHKAKKICDFNEVEEDSFYHLSFMCPNCNQAVISQPYRPNYCKHCGQKLDWSEADEN